MIAASSIEEALQLECYAQAKVAEYKALKQQQERSDARRRQQSAISAVFAKIDRRAA